MKRNSSNQVKVFYALFGLILIFALAGCNPYAPGNKMLDQGKYAEAAKYYEEKIKAKPNDPVLNNQLAFSYAKLGRVKEAESYYRKAIQLKPNYPEAHYNLGYLLMAKPMLRLDEAVKEFDKAIELRHKYAKAYNNRGVTHAYLGRFDLAIKDMEKSLALDSDNKTYKDNLEWCQRMQNVNRPAPPPKPETEESPSAEKPPEGKPK